ncbi:MAG: IS481 family transposase [Rhodocyclaceae bacterium]|nr:IS481 family transposase [Rhodocyclaceae bacterium]
MAWGANNVSERRQQFVVRASSGKEQMTTLCREFEISRPTGYAWLDRYRSCERLQDLAEISRRPHRSPNETPAVTQRRLIELRQQYPDWGAKKLAKLLENEGIQLPRITAHRILLRQGLVEERDRHRPAVKRFEREAPNQLWQMDFKGMPESRKQCLPLVLLDDHSRYLVGLFETQGTRAAPVCQKLTAAFEEHGLPEAMLMDHGTPWWNMQSQSGWTWLTVWLMRQGIRLYMSGFRHPQTQGKIERVNGCLESAMRKRPKPAGQSWQSWLDAHRQEHNHVRPHEALNMDVPAQHWTPSPRPFQPEPRPWDYDTPQNVRLVRQNGSIGLHGRCYFVSRAFIGHQVQLEFVEDRVVVYFCRTPVREFDLASGASRHFDFGQFRRARTQALLVAPDPGGYAPATPQETPFLE